MSEIALDVSDSSSRVKENMTLRDVINTDIVSGICSRYLCEIFFEICVEKKSSMASWKEIQDMREIL